MDDVVEDDYFWVTVDTEGAAAVVAGRGEIDAASATALLDAIGAAIARGGDVELDLQEVTFIDSSGLRAIIEVLRRSQAEGFDFRVTAMSEAVRRVLDLTGTTPLLER